MMHRVLSDQLTKVLSDFRVAHITLGFACAASLSCAFDSALAACTAALALAIASACAVVLFLCYVMCSNLCECHCPCAFALRYDALDRGATGHRPRVVCERCVDFEKQCKQLQCYRHEFLMFQVGEDTAICGVEAMLVRVKTMRARHGICLRRKWLRKMAMLMIVMVIMVNRRQRTTARMFVMLSDGNMMMIEADRKARKRTSYWRPSWSLPWVALGATLLETCVGPVDASEFTLTTITIIIQK